MHIETSFWQIIVAILFWHQVIFILVGRKDPERARAGRQVSLLVVPLIRKESLIDYLVITGYDKKDPSMLRALLGTEFFVVVVSPFTRISSCTCKFTSVDNSTCVNSRVLQSCFCLPLCVSYRHRAPGGPTDTNLVEKCAKIAAICYGLLQPFPLPLETSVYCS